MILDLTGKRALVGGGSQGIGLAAAIELARLGAQVTLVARDRERLESAVEKLPVHLGQHHAVAAVDYTNLSQLETVINAAISERGQFEILVNNTGGPAPGAVASAAAEEFIAAFQQHLLVNRLLVQLVAPGMKLLQFGRIINVISTSVKQPIPGLGVSNTIRGAVANWAKTLAGELAPFNITVNNVLPGATRTARLESILESTAQKKGITINEAADQMLRPIPAGRFAEPHEIGAAIAFLASPAASYITGINLPVDGGRTQCL